MKNIKYIFAIGLLLQVILCQAGTLQTDIPKFTNNDQNAMSESFYKKMTKLLELVTNKQYQEARIGFEKLRKHRSNNPFEVGTAEMMLGFIESYQGNHAQASKHFKASLDSESMALDTFKGLSFEHAKSLIKAGKYTQSIQALDEFYSKTDKIHDYFLALEAVAHVKIEQYDRAIELYNQAITLSDQVQENWHYHLYLLYVETDNNEKASETLKKLRSMNPSNQDYWHS